VILLLYLFPVPDLKTQLDNRVVQWLTQNATKTKDNNWGIDKYNISRNAPSDSSNLIETNAVGFYANGSLAEGGANVLSNFFYYMGVSDSGFDFG
jgi:hypothetical protein